MQADGNFKEDKPTDLYTSYYENGKTEKRGNYKNGNRDGKWTTFHFNGTIKEEGEYKNNNYFSWTLNDEKGKEWIKGGNGKLINYYANDMKKSEGEYRDGQQTGEWVFYFTDEKKEFLLT